VWERTAAWTVALVVNRADVAHVPRPFGAVALCYVFELCGGRDPGTGVKVAERVQLTALVLDLARATTIRVILQIENEN
jgi:hypothetical protein